MTLPDDDIDELFDDDRYVLNCSLEFHSRHSSDKTCSNLSMLVSSRQSTFNIHSFDIVRCVYEDMPLDTFVGPSSTHSNSQASSQTSEQERIETRTFLDEFFSSSSTTLTSSPWLETVVRPPVRHRTVDVYHRKISTQIICHDIEDETPCVKMVETMAFVRYRCICSI
jgi:hypothetical protein